MAIYSLFELGLQYKHQGSCADRLVQLSNFGGVTMNFNLTSVKPPPPWVSKKIQQKNTRRGFLKHNSFQNKRGHVQSNCKSRTQEEQLSPEKKIVGTNVTMTFIPLINIARSGYMPSLRPIIASSRKFQAKILLVSVVVVVVLITHIVTRMK